MIGQPHLPTILVFLKAPRLGHVKTRLAARTSDRHALEVYRHLAISQFERITSEWPVEIHFAPSDARNVMTGWLGAKYPLYPQTGGDLGARLNHAIQEALGRGAQSVICIGADCPALGNAQFQQTYALLGYGNDVVFGPCEDGGYYLVAMNRLQSAVFRDIPWSSRETLAVSLERARGANLKVDQTEFLFDIDELPDLQRAIDLGLCPRSLGSGW